MPLIEEILTTIKSIIGVPKKKRKSSSKNKPAKRKKAVPAKTKTKKTVKKSSARKTNAKKAPARSKTTKKASQKKTPVKKKPSIGKGKATKKTAKKSPIKKKVVKKKKAVKKTVSRTGKETSKNPVKKKVIKTTKKKKPAALQSAQKKRSAAPKGAMLGEITHYFNKIMVGVVKMTNGQIKVNDVILIEGKRTSFQQKILSLQVESLDVRIAKKGQLVGLKVRKPIKVGDKVYMAPKS